MEKQGVKFIRNGGSGGEANVDVELRTEFPGIGGRIITHQAVVAALREEFKKGARSGHKIFLRHAIIKKLEDYFQREGFYQFPHIPRPLGSISRLGEDSYEAYIYEWVFGSDGFPWELFYPEENGFVLLKMNDWSAFGGAFKKAGIDLRYDCADADDGRCSQNIVHQFFDVVNFEINSLWKRIDFGFSSIKMDYEKLSRFLHDNREDIRRVLRGERYDMMALSLEYLVDSSKMDRLDIGRLDALIGNYRLATLSHHRGIFEESKIARIGRREQTLV